MRLGVTGHMNLAAATVESVYVSLREEVVRSASGDLVGVSCLAAGADSIFARVVLDLGGRLEVVLPSADYREAKVKPQHAEQFDELIARADLVQVMSFPFASRDAYEAANELLLGSVDRLFAVWDGQPSNGRGGTADVVARARTRGVPVTVIWPPGAQRQ